ncbi:MAG: response regulator [Acidimicrobiales bacterium]
MTDRRVLVIDDDPVIRAIARACLQGGGIEVTEAATAEQGLQSAQEDLPDAVLLDCVLPDLDGPTAYETLLGQPATRQIPVVFLTALRRAEEQAELHSLGAAGVLTKPFDPTTLAAELRAILGWDD